MPTNKDILHLLYSYTLKHSIFLILLTVIFNLEAKRSFAPLALQDIHIMTKQPTENRSKPPSQFGFLMCEKLDLAKVSGLSRIFLNNVDFEKNIPSQPIEY